MRANLTLFSFAETACAKLCYLEQNNANSTLNGNFCYLQLAGILRSGRKLCTSRIKSTGVTRLVNLRVLHPPPPHKWRRGDARVSLFFSSRRCASRKRIFIRFAAGAYLFLAQRALDQEGDGDTGPNLPLALISLQPGQSADFNTHFSNRHRPTR